MRSLSEEAKAVAILTVSGLIGGVVTQKEIGVQAGMMIGLCILLKDYVIN